MDQIQNSLLQMVQATADRQPAQANQKPASGKEDFRKMMDQQTTEQSGAETPKAEDSAPQDGEAVETLEEPKLREQMMLAAAAMMQNPVVTLTEDPVVVAEEVPQTEAQPVAELTAQPEQTAVETTEGLKPVELSEVNPNEELLKIQQAPAETVEAPAEAPAEPEERVESVQVMERGGEPQEGDDQEVPESGGETAVFREVREIPVKVGEAPAAEQTQEAKPVEVQIGEQLTKALESGETRVEIQLTPENLGKVTIEVTLNQEGALHITLHAENPETRSLLARDMGSLQMMLTRDTQQDVRVEVPQQQENHNIYDQQHGQHQQQHSQQQRRQERRENPEDFLHQLRLGLIPVDGE